MSHTINTTLLSWIGAEGQPWVGRNFTDLLTPAGRLMWHTLVMPQLMREGRLEGTVLLLQHLQGGSLEMQINARRMPDGEAHTATHHIHMACMRLQPRHSLEHQLRTLQRVAAEAPGLLFQLRQQGDAPVQFTYVNEAMRALFGVSPAQALQTPQRVWETIDPVDLDRLRKAVQASAQQMQPLSLEYRVRQGDQYLWHETHASPVREPDGALLWHGHTLDITARKLMEHSLRDKDAAEQANRAKSAFLARMSHELRTPLNGILGFARLLAAADSGLSDGNRERAGYIESAGDSLLRLINDVLDISRIEAGQLPMSVQPVRLDDIWQQAMVLTSPQAVARRVRFVPPRALDVWVQADPLRLRQVLINLLSNAIKYGPAGGEVTLDVSTTTSGATVSVSDQGPGLSPAQQAELFQPFNRLGAEASDVDGVGLGLVISQSLVDQMGGQIALDGTVAQGATFRVSLPGAQRGLDDEAQPPARASAPEPTLPTRVWQVLYVEDNRVNAVLMQAIFEMQAHFELHVAPDGQAAIDFVQTQRPDVLLLDMHLPDTDGLSLLARLRQHKALADVPAVAVSADAMPGDITRALSSGFLAYWTKPLDVGRLMDDLTEVLAASHAAATTSRDAGCGSGGTISA